MEQVLAFLSAFNAQTIISIFLMYWFFSKHIDGKFEKLDMKIEQQAKRTDHLYEMFIELLKEKRGQK